MSLQYVVFTADKDGSDNKEYSMQNHIMQIACTCKLSKSDPDWEDVHHFMFMSSLPTLLQFNGVHKGF